MTTGATAASRSKNVRQAPKSCSVPAALVSTPRSARRAGSTQRRSSASGTLAATVSASLRRVVVSSSASRRPARARTISPRAQNVIPSP